MQRFAVLYIMATSCTAVLQGGGLQCAAARGFLLHACTVKPVLRMCGGSGEPEIPVISTSDPDDGGDDGFDGEDADLDGKELPASLQRAVEEVAVFASALYVRMGDPCQALVPDGPWVSVCCPACAWVLLELLL